MTPLALVVFLDTFWRPLETLQDICRVAYLPLYPQNTHTGLVVLDWANQLKLIFLIMTFARDYYVYKIED